MSRTLASTPAADGFRMPGEYEPHSGCWMAWPRRPDNWRDGAQPARRAFAEVAQAISGFEPVTVCANREDWLGARQALPDQIRVIELASDDAWLRDQAPSFVVNDAGDVRGVDWVFNAWGGLYDDLGNDRLIARKILDLERVDRYACPMVLEGGAIHVDGQGTLLATRECLLSPTRNPGLTEAQIEDTLKAYLNVSTIIWLDLGLYADEDTTGHIDNIACFVGPGAVALAWTDDTGDPQYERSLDAYRRLSAATDARGRKIEVIKLPQPEPLYITGEEFAGLLNRDGGQDFRAPGKRLAASYANFYIANGGVVMPGFGDKNDTAAREILEEVFPGRRVVQIPSREILLGGGNIHCITQQQPRGR